MKSKLFFLFFLIVVISGIVFATNPKIIKQVSTYFEKKEEKRTIKRVTIPTYYKLWKDEQKTDSLLPQDLIETTTSNSGKLFVNNHKGYKLEVPANWEVNNNQYSVFTKFYTKDFSMNVFVQDVAPMWMSTRQYIDNTVENLKAYHLTKETKIISGKRYIKYMYNRPLNTKIKGDLNKYTYYFYSSGHYVYTFHLKYSNDQYLTAFENSLKTFKTINKTKITNVDIKNSLSNLEMKKINFKGDKASFKIQTDQNVVGIYRMKATDLDNKNDPHYKKVGAQLLYYGLNSPYDPYLDTMYMKKRIPFVTLLFNARKVSSVNINERIINGEFDKNLYTWAKNVKKAGYPILFRLGNEMNGKWEGSNASYSYNDTDLYKLAYRHIVNIFRTSGATNAKFIWNPNGGNDPGFDWNEAEMYYPGDKYVDVIGMTVYNFGQTKYGKFTQYDDLFTDVYKDYLLSFGNKPMMVGETGSVELGGDKSKFITDMLTETPKLYPNVRMMVYFDAVHDPYDFEINTSAKSDQAFIEGMNSPNIIFGIKKSK